MSTRSAWRITLVDLSGENSVRYTPLGIMYVKAALEGDESLSGRVAVDLQAFLASTTVTEMVESIADARPDIVGFSCQGWNVAAYRQVLPTLRQLLPGAVIVLGGNHVSYQGDRWLSLLPEADVVVSGEGEQTMVELARSIVDGSPSLSDVQGITFRSGAETVSTEARPRATSLGEVASPYLTAQLASGAADIALWETNRGCPYHCAFCFWGGAVGQKIVTADLVRLRAELQVIAEAGIPTVFLCDANFGILPQDLEVACLLVEARATWGAPHTVHVNWAKNHAARVEQILDIFEAGGIRTHVYLALQTLDREALAIAGRDERGRAEMLALGRQIIQRGGTVGAELIYGLPGETLAHFRTAYDALFMAFPNLLLHPLWILPNTGYDQNRDALGIVTIRPDPLVDYEGVLEHATLDRDDNRAGLRLLVADEILLGTGWATTTVRGLVRWGGLSASAVLDAFLTYLAASDTALAVSLMAAVSRVDRECYFHRSERAHVRRAVFADRSASRALLDDFVAGIVVDDAARAVCLDLVILDTACLPRAVAGDAPAQEVWRVAHDVVEIARALLVPDSPAKLPATVPVEFTVEHAAGFGRHQNESIDLTAQWRGRVVDVARAVDPAMSR